MYLVVIEASPLGVDGTVGENHRFFGMLMSRRGRPYMGSRRRLALVRVIGIMRSLSLSFPLFSFSLSLSSHLFFSFSFDRSCCSRYARRFYYRLLTTRSVTYPRECILDFAKRGLSSERFYPLQRPRNGLTLCGPRTM